MIREAAWLTLAGLLAMGAAYLTAERAGRLTRLGERDVVLIGSSSFLAACLLQLGLHLLVRARDCRVGCGAC